MKRKSDQPLSALQSLNSFSLDQICGTWESLCGSPDITIYRDGKRFRLQLTYKQDAAFTLPLVQHRRITFFYFYGIIRIAYDDERDILLITTEGKYKRVYDLPTP